MHTADRATQYSAQPPHIQAIVDRYIEWLNQFDSFSEPPITPAAFDDDRWQGVVVDYDSGEGWERTIVLSVYNGDEGGPAQLFATTWNGELQTLTQHFDSYASIIVQSAELTSNGEKE